MRWAGLKTKFCIVTVPQPNLHALCKPNLYTPDVNGPVNPSVVVTNAQLGPSIQLR